jgi:predicted Zn-dependent peptidase
VENEVLGIVDEELFSLAYAAHPYRWPIIGWMADIDAIRREDCLAFFRTYYAPNNATLWLVGDLDPDAALASIEAHYRDIPRGLPVPSPVSTEPPQRGERRSTVRFPAHAEALAIGYRAPAGNDPDSIVLDVIQYALSAGEGGRLVRKLVYEELLAGNLLVDFAWKVDPGLFLLLVEMNPGVPAERGLARVDAELAAVARRGLSANELQRSTSQLRAQVLRELSTNNGRAHTLGTNELLQGDWRRALELPERYAAVTNEDVKRVASRIFNPSRRAVVTLLPGTSEVGHD